MLAHLAVALSLTFLAPAAARADLTLPETGGMKYHEKSGDPVRLSAYGLGTGRTYLRAATGDSFTRQKGLSEVAVSPDGRLTAGVSSSYRAGYDSVVVTDRATGKTARIRTVKKPMTAAYASWSRDGRKLALTVEQKSGGTWRVLGFTVVDVRAGTASTVRVAGLARKAGFWWSPDGNLVSMYGTGLRIYRPTDGAVLRTYADVGLPTGPEDSYAPSGKRLTTWCPSRFKEQVCLLDLATGTIAQRVAVKPAALFGWWDDTHLIAVTTAGKGRRLSVLDLTGRTTRVLADVPAATWAAELWVNFARTRVS
ncbi:TolB family protein [Nonomuraea sp. NPDC001684]